MDAQRSRGVALGALFVATLLATAGCGGARPTASHGPPLRLALPALDGGEVVVQRHRGTPVVLHFFTTGALGSQIDADKLSALHARAGDEVEIIAVALDAVGHRVVAPWRNAMKLRYLVVLATPELVAGRTGVGKITTVPTTIILDVEGRIVHRIERQLAPGELEELLSL